MDRHANSKPTFQPGPRQVRSKGPGECREFTDRLLTSLSLAEGQRDRMLFDTTCPGLGVRLTRAGRRNLVVQWTDPATKRKVREPLGTWVT